MNILAIDPGNEESAFVIWDTERKRCINKGKIKNIDMLDIISNSNYKEACIEMISSYGMPIGQTTIDSCVWIGIFKNEIENTGKKAYLIFRQSVKMHHCHSLNGINDSSVNMVLKQKYGEDNTIKKPNLVFWNEEVEENMGTKYMNGDIWSALSIATYWSEKKEYYLPMMEREEAKLSKSLL